MSRKRKSSYTKDIAVKNQFIQSERDIALFLSSMLTFTNQNMMNILRLMYFAVSDIYYQRIRQIRRCVIMNIGASTSAQDNLKAERDSPETSFDQSFLQNQNIRITYGKAYAPHKSKLDVSSIEFKAEPGTYLTTQPALSELKDEQAYLNTELNKIYKDDIAKGKRPVLPVNVDTKKLIVKSYRDGDTPPPDEHVINKTDRISFMEYGDGQIDIVFDRGGDGASILPTQELATVEGARPSLIIRSYVKPPPVY
jgi:hypothetical protein